jgi:hypothetical protein
MADAAAADAQDQIMSSSDEEVQAQAATAHQEQERLAGAAAMEQVNLDIIQEWSDDDDLSDQANEVLRRRESKAAAKVVAKANANASAVSNSLLHKQFKAPELKLFAPKQCYNFITKYNDYELALHRHSQTIQPIPLTTCVTSRVLSTIMRKNKIKDAKDASSEMIRKAIQDMSKSQDKERNKKANVIKSIEKAMSRANLEDNDDWIEVCRQLT